MPTESQKRILVLTYYWPPAGGPGVQRILKFIKYLHQYGWDVHVLTVRQGEYPAIDHSLERDIPQGVQVYKTPSFEPYRLYKWLFHRRKGGIDTFELSKAPRSLIQRLFYWIRMNLFIPDARIGWYPWVVWRGLRIIRAVRPDVILSTSPPHSVQLIAKRLAQQSNIPWVADFRDPWTDAFWEEKLTRLKPIQRLIKRWERGIVLRADHLTTISRGIMKKLDIPPQKGTVIPNGYDEDDFIHCKKHRQVQNPRFTIRYIGYLASSQVPTNLLKALRQLPQTMRGETVVEFYGRRDPSLYEMVGALQVEDCVQYFPYISHEEAVIKMCRADMLLLTIPRGHPEVLTGKLFEYLASNNFILCLCDPDAEVRGIIDRCQAGVCRSYEEPLDEILQRQYRRWKEGLRHTPDTGAIAQYSRRRLTEKLIDILKACSSRR